jgi:hypothetical protein
LNIERKAVMKRMTLLTLIATVIIPLLFSHCVTSVAVTESEPAETPPRLKARSKGFSPEAVSMIAQKYALSETAGGRVLKAAVKMVDTKELVPGSCWGYVNKVYEKAGFPKEKRTEVYKAKNTGPYADPCSIKPGDWIIYRNLPYGEGVHSAIFIEWIDFGRRSALTIEYVGNKRSIPGRYREADITKTYGIIRGME